MDSDVANIVGHTLACQVLETVVEGTDTGAHIGSKGLTVVVGIAQIVVNTLGSTFQEFPVVSIHIVCRLLLDGCGCLRMNALSVGNQIVDTQLKVTNLEGLDKKGIGTCQQGFVLLVFRSLGCQQDDGQVTVYLVVLDMVGQLVAIHFRHHHV